MIKLFLYLVQLSIRSLVIIPLIILVRFLIRKQPKIYSYALWAVVFLNLLVNMRITLPDTHRFFTPVGTVNNSLINRYDNIMDDYVGEADFYHTNTLEYYEAVENGIVPVYDGEGGSYVVTAKDSMAPPSTVENSVMPMLAVVWTSGMMTALFIFLKNLVDFHVKLSGAEKYKDNIYISHNISSPFVYGIVKPKIYIPQSMADNLPQQIILHEQAHIRRGDHIIKPVCLLITSIHWFNPLVWLAFSMMCRDMEMSCDEYVVNRTGGKKMYSMQLLDCAADKSANPVRAVLFGESKAESRIKNILSYKQPAKTVSFLLTAVVAICFTACVVEEKVEEIIPTPAPKTFYEQLAEVNSIEGMLHENAVLCERGWYNYYGEPIEANLYSPVTPDNVADAIKKSKYRSYSFSYNAMRGVVHKVDDISTGYIAYVFNSGNSDIAEDYNHIYAYKYGDYSGRYLTFDVPHGEKVVTLAGGWERMNDDFAILSYYTSDDEENIWFNAQKINTTGENIELGELVRCKIENSRWFAPRATRFLNEKVGIMGRMDRGEPDANGYENKYKTPRANITIDGGKTWHQLDFSTLIYPEYFTGYRSCCMKLNGNRIEIRYFTDFTGNAKPDENGNLPYRTGSESYSIISEDCGLTWAGYLRGYDWNEHKEVFTQVTETIPVQILD